MIVGIGLDVVDLGRLAHLLERHGEAFVRRVCLDGEARVTSGPARTAHVGGLFAAKEAAMKALGTGWAAGVTFRQIEVVRAPGGAPTLRLHGEAERRARALGVERSHLTISHDGRSAAAVVVLERAGGSESGEGSDGEGGR
jgi:holo-[acyl-carrier protein] synthase